MLETMFKKLSHGLKKSKYSLLSQLENLGDGTRRIYIYPNQTNKVYVKNKVQETVLTRYK